MATSNINVRVDSELKEEAEDLFKDLGLNMSTAITMFLKSAVSNNGIPFEVKRPSLNAETRAALAEYYVMKREKDGYKRYDSFEDFLKEVEDET
ncbi:MAG TPA: type II toxin-antitoxin system antitoxin, RelB/DinJ family [Lachnospiraceae bacterium]|nr:type II toxin-antitoxin system RelB/DinJ family antitoxin [Acutalibacteraceae bacterium]HCE77884.1 type II toxin-antitoxin system antitoxin, RelB/DinJ family [Lachnospiraceae bacterium]